MSHAVLISPRAAISQIFYVPAGSRALGSGLSLEIDKLLK